MILSVFFQLLAGALWLGALLMSANTMLFSVQTISSIRGVYSSLLSVFLVAHIQGSDAVKREPSTTSHRLIINPAYFFCAVPTLIVFLLDGRELAKNLGLLFVITLLYVLVLVFRDRSGTVKSSSFEVVSPILLLAVLCTSSLVGVEVLAVVMAVSFLAGSRFVGFSLHSLAKRNLFQLVTQFPLYFSPLILIFFRSEIYVDISIDGTNEAFMEGVGLVINGLGGALAMALIMRKSEKLLFLSLVFIFLMLVTLVAVSIATISLGGSELAQVISSLICIEFARLSVWMIHTDLIKRSSSSGMSILYNSIGAIGVFLVFYFISLASFTAASTAINILFCYLVIFFIFMTFSIFEGRNRCLH